MKKILIVLVIMSFTLPLIGLEAKMDATLKNIIVAYKTNQIPKTFSMIVVNDLDNNSATIEQSSNDQNTDSMFLSMFNGFLAKKVLVSTVRFLGVGSPLYFWVDIDSNNTSFSFYWTADSEEAASNLATSYKDVLRKLFSKQNAASKLLVNNFNSYSKGSTVYASWKVPTSQALALVK